jgi:ABC-type Mn2+/Zn2+ transport system ATPase subunit
VAPEVVVRARELTLAYGDRPVLEGVSLEVRDGEAWFLIGPNASGKTTLLRALLGMLAPRAGLLERSAVLEERRAVGYVPQQGGFRDTLPTTVREFVSFGFVRSSVPPSERREALAWALARTGLGGAERKPFRALSGGQRQRVLLARALARRPELLILDEPTEGLDLPTQDALLATLERLHAEQGLTLLVVTHRLDIARRHASHVALFAGGRVTAGPREAILAGEEIARAFTRVELAVP